MTSQQQFTIYPALDILQGACVRLVKGDYDSKTEYSPSPVDVALRWLSEGARFLHVVDLDGAKAGKSVNEQVVANIVSSAKQQGAHVQVGGGIRTYEAIERWLTLGVSRVVIGTAIQDELWVEGAIARFGSAAIVAGLDGRNGKLATNGWTLQTEVALPDLGAKLFALGIRNALVTDVERDGTLMGANLVLAKQVQAKSQLAVIASGGIRDVADMLAAKASGLAGAILGKSLYAGTIRLREALQALAEVETC